MAKAKYYLMTADFIDGREAERIGLVSKAVPAEEVLADALAIAERLALGPQDATPLPAFEASLAYEMLNFLGPDSAEGHTALLEKRSPNFDGLTGG
jgi:enoyl-CoA hydratase